MTEKTLHLMLKVGDKQHLYSILRGWKYNDSSHSIYYAFSNEMREFIVDMYPEWVLEFPELLEVI